MRSESTPAPSVPLDACRIPIGDVIRTSWQRLAEQFWSCLGGLLLVAVLGICAALPLLLVIVVLSIIPVIGQIVAPLFIVVVTAWLMGGLSQFYLHVARGETAEIGMLFRGGPYLWNMAGGLLLVNASLSVPPLLGFVLAFLPTWLFQADAAVLAGLFGSAILGTLIGGLWLLCVSLSPLALVDGKAQNCVDAIRLSVRLMWPNLWRILVAEIAVGLMGSVLIVLTLGLGLLVVIPFHLVFVAVVYLRATGFPGTNTPQPQGGTHVASAPREPLVSA